MTTTWNSRNLNPNNVLDVILTGYWNDSATWNDTQIWSDTGGQTSFTTRSIPNTSWNERTGLLDYGFDDPNVIFDSLTVRFDGNQSRWNTRIIP